MRHSSQPHRPHVRAVRQTIPPPPRPMRPWVKGLLGALTLLALLAVGGAMYASRAARPETVALESGVVEWAVEADAFVVRKEQVYKAPAAGTVERLVKEGQRVRVGAPVVRIVPAGTTAAAPAPAPTTATPTTSMPTTSAPTAPATTTTAPRSAVRQQLDEVEAAIYAKARAVNVARDQGDAAEVDRLYAELDQLVLRQVDLVKKLGREEATPVVAEAPRLNQPDQPAAPAPGGNTTPGTSAPPAPRGTEVASDVAGVAVFQTDGLEATLSPVKAGEWTPARIKALTPDPRPTGETAAAGAPIFKVVDNLSLQLLAVVPKASIPAADADPRLELRLTGFADPVPARVARSVAEGDEVLLVLTAPVFPDELIRSRKARSTLVFASYRGIIAPKSAIDIRDGLQGVWVVDGSTERFYAVKVLGGNETHVALETALAPGIRIRKDAPTRMR